MKRYLSLLAAVILLGIAETSVLGAQQPMAGSDAARAGTLNIFLDCNSCDFDYLRTEIDYVNYVRDRQVADVHILVTTQRTGSGGTEYTLTLIGLQRFSAMTDTLVYTSGQTNTSDEIRRGLARSLKLGIVRYLAKTADGARIVVTYNAPKGAASASAPQKDPWNYWVFRTSVNGFTNGEKTSKFLTLFGSISASRTTNEWKLNFSGNESYNEQRFQIGETTSIANIQRDHGASGVAVKSLGPHWSTGLTGSLSSSVFSNQRIALRLTPAIEYDLFPYAEATRRQLRLQYGIGVHAFRYRDTTIFLKTAETLPVQSLSIAYSVRQPWGSVSAGANGSMYLNDTKKRQGSISGNANLRIVKGLNLNFSGSYSSIHDQIYLKKGGTTEAEVLLRQRQLLTSYRYFGSVGLSYTFGSIFNNIVNPRFGDGEGGRREFFF